jgi:hypothetical protein
MAVLYSFYNVFNYALKSGLYRGKHSMIAVVEELGKPRKVSARIFGAFSEI